ncbi:adenosine deaminase, partial [Streptomyces sp. WAC 05379]
MTSETAQKANTPSSDQIRRAPKVLLHDHLDGGLRPGTIVELARDTVPHSLNGAGGAPITHLPET